MRTLPDHLRKGMKLIIIGCHPTESSVRVGHYYAGRDNEFWPMIFEGGVVPEPFDYRDDKRVIEFGIGLTDLVKRPSKTMEELAREDFAEGRIVLSQKLEEYAPRVVAFNGKTRKARRQHRHLDSKPAGAHECPQQGFGGRP